MKNPHRILPILIGLFWVAVTSAQKDTLNISKEEQAYFNSDDAEAVEIKDDESEYEIIIIEPGFNFWLNSLARPEGYYSKTFLDNFLIYT